MSLQPQAFEGTSTGSIGGRRSPWLPVVAVLGTMSTPGTALHSNSTTVDSRGQIAWSQTHSLDPRPPVESAQSTSAAVAELRRLSGLTWEQLAGLFDASRRSLHFWASGKPINAVNEEHLRRALFAMQQADRGTAQKNREMLLHDKGGTIALDLLCRKQYGEFLRLVGQGTGRVVRNLQPLSREARQARKPLSPAQQLDTLHDRAHIDIGRGRAARTLRNTRRKRD